MFSIEVFLCSDIEVFLCNDIKVFLCHGSPCVERITGLSLREPDVDPVFFLFSFLSPPPTAAEEADSKAVVHDDCV